MCKIFSLFLRLASHAHRCVSSWLSTITSSLAGASSTSPSPSSNPCLGSSVPLSKTRPVDVRRNPTNLPNDPQTHRTRRLIATKMRTDGGNVSPFPSTDAVSAECEKSSATTYYWYREALDISDSISEGGGLNWKMTLCLLGAWTLVCLAMIKGIQSSGKVRTILSAFGVFVSVRIASPCVNFEEEMF